MLQRLLDFFCDAPRLAVTALGSATTGQVLMTLTTDVILQRAAWTVAILAGLGTIINLFYPLRHFYDASHNSQKSTHERKGKGKGGR